MDGWFVGFAPTVGFSIARSAARVLSIDIEMPPFAKGNKGGGRPKGFKGVSRLIMEKTKDGRELVDFALRVFRDEDEYHHNRWQALEWLADRGLGRAVHTVELDAAISAPPVSPKLDLARLTPHQRAQMRDVLLRALARPVPVAETATGTPLRLIEGDGE